jgi:hypothetical protein
MIDNNDEQISKLFARAETDLSDEDFNTRIMHKISRQKKQAAVLKYGSWVLALLCLLSISTVTAKLFLYLGSIISSLPILLMKFLQPYMDFSRLLLVLAVIISYLLIRFRLIRLPQI